MGQGITFLVRVGRGQRLILFIYILYLLSGDGWYANISTAIVFVKDYRKAVVVVLPTYLLISAWGLISSLCCYLWLGTYYTPSGVIACKM